jgi:hypothetical protein
MGHCEMARCTEIATDCLPNNLTLRPNPDVISKRLDQATILVHFPTNRIFELNETGTRVWELLGQSCDIASIVRFLVDEFDIGEVRAAEEVKTLLDQLRAASLLVS